MHTKHILSALLTFPFSLWATGSGSDWTATSALQFQQQSDTQVTVGDNVISFTTSSTERMTLDANGNVGIGVTTPSNKLEIKTSATVGESLQISKGNSGTTVLLGDGGSVNAVGILRLFDTGVEKTRVYSAGDSWFLNNIGIGTDLPTAKLHLKGSYTGGSGDHTDISNAQLKLESDIGYIRIPHISEHSSVSSVYNYQTGKNVYWGEPTDAGSYIFRGRDLTVENGNVGIGTTDPTAKLQVSGGDLLLQNPTSGYPALWLKDVAGTNTLKLDYNSIIGDGDDLIIRSGGSNDLVLNDNGGNVGIGTASPTRLLELKGSAPVISLRNTLDGTTAYAWVEFNDSNSRMGYIGFGSSGNNNMYLTNEAGGNTLISYGNVGIGTAAPSHKLHVVGNVHASSFSAEPSFVWPDYVFEDSYELNELEQVEKYIEKNHHLPEIPSAAEVKENGVDIVSMQAKLLQKIEELTLYVIAQQKEIEALKTQIKQ